MTESKYQIGDRVSVDDSIRLIIGVDYLQLSGKYLYIVDFDNAGERQRIVAEKELRDFCDDD